MIAAWWALLASALAAEPWMWGVGATAGIAIATHPGAVEVDRRPLLPAGRIGLDGVIYPVEHQRARLFGRADVGARWWDLGLGAMWSYVPRARRFQVPVGVGGVVGTSRLGTAGGDRLDEAWVAPRGEISLLREERQEAWQLTAFVEGRLPVSSVRRAADGDRSPIDGRPGVGFGLELTGYLGDFAPPAVRPGWGR